LTSPNHFYSYSFVHHDWPQYFSTQPVLLEYFRRCAEDFGVLDNIRFGTEVCSATFDEESCRWTLRLRTGDGEQTPRGDRGGQRGRPAQPALLSRHPGA
jgi:4-hydroxyacetophenone monooxygenase